MVVIKTARTWTCIVAQNHDGFKGPTSSQIIPLIGQETYFHLGIRANFSAAEMYLHNYLIYGALQADKETNKASGLVSQK